MSLQPKLSEVEEFLLRKNIQIGCFVESWLKPHISDTVVNIEGYNIVRKDRLSHDHGGVCVYIKEDIKYQIVEELMCCDVHEVLWIKLNPARLPRGFSCVIVAVVYYPGPTSPAECDAQLILNHLFDSLMKAQSIFSNCGLVVTGDFNRLKTRRLQNHFKLKQLVKFPTRGQATLDLILTNMADKYAEPESFPPFGLSDHVTVIVAPKARDAADNTRISITTRDTRESKKVSLGRYLCNIDWACVYNQSACEEKLNIFLQIIQIGIDNIMPERTRKVHPKDAPWMTIKLKELIRSRQEAFHADRHGPVYRFYRNKVNKERKACKGKYYTSKVQDLKGVNPREWWKEINKLSGAKKKSSNLINSLNVPDFAEKSPKEIANAINNALLEPMLSYEALDNSSEDLYLPLEDIDPEFLQVSTAQVHKNLMHLNKHKAAGPDGLANWCLREYADLLYEPVTNILNASYQEQRLPSVWKKADIAPLPKVKQVTIPKKELRPISLTASLSKIAEEFVVLEYVKPAFQKIVDPNQFGTISGSSTVLALISMIHSWLKATDGNGAAVRVLLFDYRKAFDLIDHKTLVAKLKMVDIPRSVINWIINFLTDRLQRVKLSNACRSEWGSIPSGVPQGTKLGPWLFLLMINDLSPPSTLFDLWKYVDDTTVSEVVKKGQISFAQQAVDHISEWSGNNLFQLNREKTKELVISFSHASPQFPPVTMDGGLIEVTEKAKLLGVIINNSLTWNDHVEELVINAGRKLYFLTQLKRARVTSQDLVAFYCACVRSSLDYACAVFHFSLPQYLQTELERIQKRALFTIYPGLSYAEALVEAGIESIQDHQRQLSINLFCAISENPDNKLNKLVPPIITSNYNLRKTRKFRVPVANTKRFAESFIMKGAQLA